MQNTNKKKWEKSQINYIIVFKLNPLCRNAAAFVALCFILCVCMCVQSCPLFNFCHRPNYFSHEKTTNFDFITHKSFNRFSLHRLLPQFFIAVCYNFVPHLVFYFICPYHQIDLGQYIFHPKKMQNNFIITNYNNKYCHWCTCNSISVA